MVDHHTDYTNGLCNRLALGEDPHPHYRRAKGRQAVSHQGHRAPPIILDKADHYMTHKKLGIEPTVHETASIRDSRLGRYTEVGARTSIAETDFGDYSYIVHDGSIIYASIGKYCSIAAFVRINPGNHATWRASQHHFTYRSRQYGFELD